MKYSNRNYIVPAKHRAKVNENILMLIDSGDLQEVTPEEIYNTYTGIGGLHGLNFDSYENRHQYTEAKKEVEQGQFFTPATIAAKMASLIDLRPTEFIADLTAGAGIFVNYFTEQNFYGCEIDGKAFKVAKFLYPECRIELQDLRFYNPQVRFDFVIGNPPFNLMWEAEGRKVKSQQYYFEKAAALLRPGGLVIAIVPLSYCADEMFSRSEIDGLNENFNFLAQVELPKEAFKMLGVAEFATKVMFMQRKSETLDATPYSPTFTTWENAAGIFNVHKELARKMKVKANAEMTDEAAQFEYKLRKYLYEIKTHKILQPFFPECIEYVEKYRNQRCPDNMEFEKWWKHHRITPKDVLRKMQRTIAKQNVKEIEKTELVKTTYGFRLKAYSKKHRHALKNADIRKQWTFNEIILEGTEGKELPRLTPGFNRLIERKRKQYQLQETPFKELAADANISNFMSQFTFLSKGKQCHFNEIQHSDISKHTTKDYSILNWQQGGGKTGAGYAFSKYKNRKTFIISSALSINITWTKFLKENKQKFVNVRSMDDIKQIATSDYVIISHGYVIKHERHLKKAVKMLSRKVSLILDESDEITNHLAKRTRACKSIFQRVQYKLLTTGTTTRNKIAELYTQLELLYNNSVNFICTAPVRYIDDKENGLQEEKNEYCGRPFSPYFGNRLFKQSFNPSKTTVFGIKQQNQNIYNEVHLRHLIGKTISTRKFKEIAGDKYTVVNMPVRQSVAERHVYRKILRESHSIIQQYYESTGNSRKDALLRMIRQIQLLIKATSLPNSFKEYEGSAAPNKALAIIDEIRNCPDKVAIGCITIEALEYYKETVKNAFPERPIFIIEGDVNFNKRGSIIDKFEATKGGILICTQQSLKSSVNIPACKNVYIESLQWNIPTIEQFYFRFIRYDSVGITTVKFFNYHDTIEANLLALLMAKEKLNDYIKTLEFRENEDMYNEFGIDLNILDLLITKDTDEDGKVQLNWGKQEFFN